MIKVKDFDWLTNHRRNVIELPNFLQIPVLNAVNVVAGTNDCSNDSMRVKL